MLFCCTQPPTTDNETDDKNMNHVVGKEKEKSKDELQKWKGSPVASIKKNHGMRKKYIPKSLRIAVWNRYIGEEIGCTICPVCKTNKISQLNFHCGHVIAEAKGGPTNIDNLRPVCAQCNLSMGKKNLMAFKEMYFGE